MPHTEIESNLFNVRFRLEVPLINQIITAGNPTIADIIGKSHFAPIII
jgi:hypothetical protein